MLRGPRASARRRGSKLFGSAMPRHFLTGAELDAADLGALLDRALELKAAPRSSRALEGRSIGLVFEKPSTRTRVSFEVGVVELGGHPLILRPDELQLSRGEPLRDTALVLSRHLDAVGVRTGPQAVVDELAPYRLESGDGHPWHWGMSAGDADEEPSGRVPGAQSRWNAGRDLSFEPLRIELVCEVAYDHLQGDRFRHATTFRRWRPDRLPSTCRYDQLETAVPEELSAVFAAR